MQSGGHAPRGKEPFARGFKLYKLYKLYGRAAGFAGRQQ